jgi:hypothetical protein
MGAHHDVAERPEVSATKYKQDEIIKKVRKLRWMGLHDEAFQMERGFFASVSAEVVRSDPISTD